MPSIYFELLFWINIDPRLQSVRARLSADMADHSGVIRSLVVRAEDSRIMGDMKSLRKWSSQLYDINRDLVSEPRDKNNDVNDDDNDR